jgi:hypothetical protein
MTFSLETRPSNSPFVDSVWRARSERAGSFFSVASLHWEMILTRRQDKTFFTVRGPRTWATEQECSADVE